MNDFIKEHIRAVLAELELRLIKTISSLNDEDLNWRPNNKSNSIANLVIHISGHIHQRIEVGIMQEKDCRNREAEFSRDLFVHKESLINTIHTSFSRFMNVVEALTEEEMLKTQVLSGNRTQTNVEIMLRCLEHYSEHLGQIIYISKMR
ncbi:DUF1572 family protein [Metabacillus niabensis]|uniref:Damage-inducible protein DinB n=1 Tax=Metabacillus niabensis TaxID=324854 RepID=A0ABT9Z1T6_9BACI|nr:DUF1572 family protein [Metabacillus niabensis]MDQ0225802.1 putative damage-inducible protein DinB [Metabacillus niabensis]